MTARTDRSAAPAPVSWRISSYCSPPSSVPTAARYRIGSYPPAELRTPPATNARPGNPQPALMIWPCGNAVDDFFSIAENVELSP